MELEKKCNFGKRNVAVVFHLLNQDFFARKKGYINGTRIQSGDTQNQPRPRIAGFGGVTIRSFIVRAISSVPRRDHDASEVQQQTR